ncbi:helix-hairpin-helix domain-containing protein [Massilia sp. B-10]|nr:helix-hairpin-helix domain-containing protein [Massilia sp. B-10]
MPADFALLGYTSPAQLAGLDPLDLYRALCLASGQRQDPCVLDVFMSVTDFLVGRGAAPVVGFHRRAQAPLRQPAVLAFVKWLARLGAGRYRPAIPAA